MTRDSSKTKQDQEDEALKDKWRTEFIKGVVTETFQLIRGQEKKYGLEFGQELRFGILASLVSTLVYESISVGPDQQVTPVLFEDVKEAVCSAVTSGVEGAVQSWTGEPLQYYCEILPEPAAINREPC